MHKVDLDTWADFERELEQLEIKRCELVAEPSTTHVSNLLFRGQSDASWHLTTTLEREVGDDTPLADYISVIQRIRAEVETFTKRSWNLPDDTADLLERKLPLPSPIAAYEYMAYLRHNRFPSPLLDWTQSPYIAAFFAFAEDRDSENVAIFAYLEYAGRGKAGWVAEPQIYSVGPNIRTAKSHELQQSEYTFCCRQVKDGGRILCSHESAFGRNSDRQDLLWQFTLPARERKGVLSRLDKKKISSFSLFDSEEGLLRSLANREFLFAENPRCMENWGP